MAFKTGDIIKIVRLRPAKTRNLIRSGINPDHIIGFTSEIVGVFHLDGRDENPTYALDGYVISPLDGFYDDELKLI